MDNISKPTSNIAARHPTWKRNRDLIAGEDAVKSTSAQYIPRLAIHDSGSFANADEAYRTYLARTNFFPASAKILEGIKGMVFRKSPHFKCATSLTAMFETITKDGKTVDDLAEDVVEEVLVTNFCGLLVDHPPVPLGASRAQAEAINARPFVTMYRAESILEVSAGVVNDRRVLLRVRLLDNADTVREMTLVDGRVIVTIYDRSAENWIARDAIMPTRLGQPLREIPFIVITTKARSIEPQKAVMDDVVSLNIQLFQAQANAGNSLFYCSMPLLVFKGVAASNVQMSAGAIIYLEGHSTDAPKSVEYVEFTGVAHDKLADAVQQLKDELAVVGSRVIATDDKSGVESADALAIRRDSENSVLASYAKTVSRAIRETLQIAQEWAGSTEAIEFDLSTDFTPSRLSAQDRAQIVAEWMAGFYSHQTALEQFKQGEVLPDSFDIEKEINLVDQENLAGDRPSAI